MWYSQPQTIEIFTWGICFNSDGAINIGFKVNPLVSYIAKVFLQTYRTFLANIVWDTRKITFLIHEAVQPKRHLTKHLICLGFHYDDVIMGTIGSQITSLTIVYSTVYSGADQSKHQSSTSLAFVWGIHRGPVNSPHKWPVTRKMFPFDDVIMLIK